jgi:hypothetical protein
LTEEELDSEAKGKLGNRQIPTQQIEKLLARMKNNEKLAEKIITFKDNPLELLAIIIELEREEKELKKQVRKLKEQNSLIRKLQSRGDALPPPPLALFSGVCFSLRILLLGICLEDIEKCVG